MIRKRLVKRTDPVVGGYQPTLHITVEGLDDVYRLARHLETGQVDLHELGRRILHSMDRQAPGSVSYLTKRMGPARARYRGRRPRPVQLRLGITEAELAQLEEAVK